MMSVNQYMKEQDAHAEREEAISDLSVHIGQVIKSGNIYQACDVFNPFKRYWTMDDFCSDVEINPNWMANLIDDEPRDMQEDMAEKFDKFCEEIAEQCLDEVNEIARGE